MAKRAAGEAVHRPQAIAMPSGAIPWRPREESARIADILQTRWAWVRRSFSRPTRGISAPVRGRTSIGHRPNEANSPPPDPNDRIRPSPQRTSPVRRPPSPPPRRGARCFRKKTMRRSVASARNAARAPPCARHGFNLSPASRTSVLQRSCSPRRNAGNASAGPAREIDSWNTA